MAAGGLCLAGAAIPVSTAGASGPPKYSFAYYDLHPCSLITSGQVKSVFGTAVGPGRTILPHVDGGPGGGKCEYSTANEEYTLTYSFETGTAASEKAVLPGPFVNEPTVSHGAFCVAKGLSVGWLYANVGTYHGKAENLSIVDTSCTYSVKFARDAFARLS
jgi:hypothetical protein